MTIGTTTHSGVRIRYIERSRPIPPLQTSSTAVEQWNHGGVHMCSNGFFSAMQSAGSHNDRKFVKIEAPHCMAEKKRSDPSSPTHLAKATPSLSGLRRGLREVQSLAKTEPRSLPPITTYSTGEKSTNPEASSTAVGTRRRGWPGWKARPSELRQDWTWLS